MLLRVSVDSASSALESQRRRRPGGPFACKTSSKLIGSLSASSQPGVCIRHPMSSPCTYTVCMPTQYQHGLTASIRPTQLPDQQKARKRKFPMSFIAILVLLACTGIRCAHHRHSSRMLHMECGSGNADRSFGTHLYSAALPRDWCRFERTLRLDASETWRLVQSNTADFYLSASQESGRTSPS
jgi:hypothetical protein